MKYWLFPFGEIERNSRIIIWGYGVVGKQYIDQIRKTNYCDLVAVVDKRYLEISCNINKIDSPSIIQSNMDCYIIIAQSNTDIAEEIKSAYYEMGGSREKIIHKAIEADVSGLIPKHINNMLSNQSYGIQYLTHIVSSIESMLLDSRSNNNTKEMDYYKKLHNELIIKKPIDFDFIRVGAIFDGGYVMVNCFEKCEKIAYSFGVANEISWETEMAQKGFDVYMYDHTIDFPVINNPMLHFFKMGIADSPYHDDNLSSLEDYIGKNGHKDKKRMILKMDVEGAEYGFLQMVNSDTLAQFDQITLELHYLTFIDEWGKKRGIVDCLKKINKTHQVVHVHGNNFCRVVSINGNLFPQLLEVTFLIRKNYSFKEDENVFLPRAEDAQCFVNREDIHLGFWNKYQL